MVNHYAIQTLIYTIVIMLFTIKTIYDLNKENNG